MRKRVPFDGTSHHANRLSHETHLNIFPPTFETFENQGVADWSQGMQTSESAHKSKARHKRQAARTSKIMKTSYFVLTSILLLAGGGLAEKPENANDELNLRGSPENREIDGGSRKLQYTTIYAKHTYNAKEENCHAWKASDDIERPDKDQHIYVSVKSPDVSNSHIVSSSCILKDCEKDDVMKGWTHTKSHVEVNIWSRKDGGPLRLECTGVYCQWA